MDNSQVVGVKKEKDPIVRTLMKVFWILLIVTVIEVTLALLHYFTGFIPRSILNGIFILLTIVKAFYIVAEFMHMGHEVKQLVLIILVPLFFLIWGIGATMWEGAATNKARNGVGSIIESVEPWQSPTRINKE